MVEISMDMLNKGDSDLCFWGELGLALGYKLYPNRSLLIANRTTWNVLRAPSIWDFYFLCEGSLLAIFGYYE